MTTKTFLGIAIIVLAAEVTYAMKLAYRQDKKVTIVVTLQEADLIFKALGKLPLEESGNLFFTLQRQVQTQLQPQKNESTDSSGGKGNNPIRNKTKQP